jgi:response regulator RpfG family c-di-GMP phosphodiesterase
MESEVKRKILLVDDEFELAASIKDALEMKNLNVLMAHSVSEGLALVEKHHQDLSFIVCDCKLSESETGFDLRKQMNDSGYKEIPLCILSGFLTKELALEGIEHAIWYLFSVIRRKFRVSLAS